MTEEESIVEYRISELRFSKDSKHGVDVLHVRMYRHLQLLGRG